MKFYKHILNFLTNKKEYGQKISFLKLALKLPLILSSFVVILFSKIKRVAFSSVNTKDSGLFVVSFGNINMGGAGKTPFALSLAEYLYEKGLRPCIISRGYKGGLKKKSI